MRKLLILFIPILLFLPNLVLAQTNQGLIISELMPNPSGTDSLYEWIELANTNSSSVNINNWQLNGVALPNFTLDSGEYLILASNSNALKQRYPGLLNVIEFDFSLPNAGTTIFLDSNNSSQQFKYIDAKEDISFELRVGNCNLILPHPTNNTIASPNTSCSQETNTDSTTALIRIKSIYPNPKPGDVEWISLENLGDKAVSLTNWKLVDASGKKDSLGQIEIQANAEYQFFTKSVTLNNAGDRIILKDDKDRSRDVIEYLSSSSGDVFGLFQTIETSSVQKETQQQKQTYTISNSSAVCTETTRSNFAKPKLYLLK